MTSKDQKARELAAVAALLRHVPEVRDSVPHLLDVDPPDVRVDKIGIEVADYMSDLAMPTAGSQGLKVEQARHMATELARRIYLEAGGKPVTVHVHFRDGQFPATAAFSRAVAAAVRDAEPKARQSYRIEWGELSEELEPHVYSIFIYRIGELDTWQCDSGGSVAMTWEHIEPLIRKKEADLPRWTSECSQRWLLIVARGSAHGAFSFVSSIPQIHDMAESVVVTELDRVYVLEMTQNVAVRVA